MPAITTARANAASAYHVHLFIFRTFKLYEQIGEMAFTISPFFRPYGQLSELHADFEATEIVLIVAVELTTIFERNIYCLGNVHCDTTAYDCGVTGN